MRSVLSLGVTSLLLLTGCYESRERLGGTPSDGGVVIVGDASSPREDAAPRDAARRDAPPVCTGDVVEPYEGPPCRPDTVECLSRCEGDSCNECYARDPDCSLCVNATFVGCANAIECQALWDEFACCAQTSGCAGARGVELLACAEQCIEEFERYGSCATPIFSMSMECQAEVSTLCLP